MSITTLTSVGFGALNQNLSVSGDVEYEEDPKTLYGVLKKAASEGIYAKEYTGEHHDSFLEEPTQKIYYWHADRNSTGNTRANAILNKNNVIFADHCWQMYRTTDTGGVKMIYNGEVDNGQCLNTRSSHPGYSTSTTQSMSTSYYYGTSYSYDKTNKVFSLAGTITTGTINEGLYTCKKTTSDETCTALYYLYRLYSGTTYYYISIYANSHYSQYGKLQFNNSPYSLAYEGYMYNLSYTRKDKAKENMGTLVYTSVPILESNYNVISNDATYPFTFDSSTKNWTSTMKQNSTSASIKFKVTSNNDYIISYTVSSEKNYDKAYFYKNGVELKNDSGNNSGTIDLQNLTTNDEIEVKYSKDSSTSSGSDSVSFNVGTLQGEPEDNRYQFGNDVEYINGEYKLKDTIRAEGTDSLTNHHYTCLSTGDTCSKVNYIYYGDNMFFYYIELENGKLVNDALNDLINNVNINQRDSTIKSGLDGWYKRYMINYTSKLEDTIFCVDRSIYSLGGWDPNSVNLSFLNFKGAAPTTDLSCTNIIDRYSLSNNVAQLSYPVGLMTYPEVNLLYNSNLIKTGEDYWIGSPLYFSDVAYGQGVSSSGGQIYSSYGVSSTYGVRPVISLKSGTEYISGTGSMSDPYIVE